MFLRIRFVLLQFSFALLVFGPLNIQVPAPITGNVVDGTTGEPVARAPVVLSETNQRAATDEKGLFKFPAQPNSAGTLTLYVIAPGYALARRIVKPGSPAQDIEIVLVPEGAAVTEELTVTTGPFESLEPTAASEQTLRKPEIQGLSMVLVGDALRAGQALPGVSANNDLRTDFSVRGAPFERIGVYVDGVLTDNFVHTFIGADTNDRVSLSLINQDTVGQMSIFPGAFPAKYGDSTAAIAAVDTREGNRVRPAGRFGTGLIATSGVVDGPFANNRGSWLFSGRTSYVDYMQRLIQSLTGTDDESGDSQLTFSDANINLSYNLSPVHKVGLSSIFGTFGGNQGDKNRLDHQADPDTIDRFKSRNALLHAHWTYTPGPNFVNTVRGFLVKGKYHIENAGDFTLDDKDRTQYGLRSDAAFQLALSQRTEAGFYGRVFQAKKTSASYRTSSVTVLERYDRDAEEDSYYLQQSWNVEGLPLLLTGGARVDHSSLTGQALVSPRMAIAFDVGGYFNVRAGTGVYRQFPDFDQMFGFFGNSRLRAEKAAHYNFRIERNLGPYTRIFAETYDREEHGLAFSLSEPRLDSAGQPSFTSDPYRNSLDGYARGVELTLQRRSSNGLTGWVSYAYSRSRLRDALTGLSFVSDVDQRHTLNLFGTYRVRQTVSLSSQFRYGSGQPIPGFLKSEGSVVTLSAERNQVRLSDYSRLDIRASKAFLRRGWKWTLSGEVLNLLNHKNTYNVNSDIIRFRSTGAYHVGLGESFGILPSVGIHFEF